jgi:hypothetical protein
LIGVFADRRLNPRLHGLGIALGISGHRDGGKNRRM